MVPAFRDVQAWYLSVLDIWHVSKIHIIPSSFIVLLSLALDLALSS